MFQVVIPAFRDRNYGDRGLHHTTMRVDYEVQVFNHFFGRDETLRRRGKAFVVDANLDTGGFLDEAIERVQEGRRLEPSERGGADAAREPAEEVGSPRVPNPALTAGRGPRSRCGRCRCTCR